MWKDRYTHTRDYLTAHEFPHLRKFLWTVSSNTALFLCLKHYINPLKWKEKFNYIKAASFSYSFFPHTWMCGQKSLFSNGFFSRELWTEKIVWQIFSSIFYDRIFLQENYFLAWCLMWVYSWGFTAISLLSLFYFLNFICLSGLIDTRNCSFYFNDFICQNVHEFI